MNDDLLERSLSDGLADLARTAALSDPESILARTAPIRQRRVRLSFQRSAFPSGRPALAVGSETRRSFMMNTFRYGTVAVIALAAGLALPMLLGGPSPSPLAGSPEPSGGADPAVGWVTGTVANSPSCTGPTSEVEFGVGTHHRDYSCHPQAWVVSDPRLSGTGTTVWNDDTYPSADGGSAAVITASVQIENDGGSWVCAASPWVVRAAQRHDQFLPTWLRCDGQGGYSGLVAVLAVSGGLDDRTIEGVLLRGSLPPTP